MNLQDKQIVVGITGGIAAYKVPNLVRLLRAQGVCVRVVMTEAAKQFITPITLQAVSGQPVHDNLFDAEQEAAMGHIELARWADLVIIAPAAAQSLAKLAHGFADDLLTTLVLATQSPVMVAPAMNRVMWEQPITQANVAALKARGIHVLPVAEGEQACGEVGPGRMLEPENILTHVCALWMPRLLEGKRVLITAGPTQEPIDPVRYISNPSSGKMGYALAQVAHEMGAIVTLISGPTTIKPPSHVETHFVDTALAMYDKVMTHISGQDIFIATAAVGDYRIDKPSDHKIKKTEDTLTLHLVKNPDILKTVAKMSKRPICIGFAAETDNTLEHAKQKLLAKNADMICMNDISQPGIGFESDDNQLTLITRDGIQSLEKMSKYDCAKEVLKQVNHVNKMLTSHLSCV